MTPEARAWHPPDLSPTDPTRIPAMNGSRLLVQPRHVAEADAVRAFLDRPRPAAMEIGFDHGMCLVDRARAFPDTLQLGVEIREARVRALQPHLPANAHAWRVDARSALLSVVPDRRLSVIYVLFPDPVWKEALRHRHLLFSPAFTTLCARALAPDGILHVATDVQPYFAFVGSLLGNWIPADPPRMGAELSRRERVCKRDGVPIHRGSWRAPIRLDEQGKRTHA